MKRNILVDSEMVGSTESGRGGERLRRSGGLWNNASAQRECFSGSAVARSELELRPQYRVGRSGGAERCCLKTLAGHSLIRKGDPRVLSGR
jgi:hypothetical protein